MVIRSPRMAKISAVSKSNCNSIGPAKVPTAGMQLSCSSPPMRSDPSEMVAGSAIVAGADAAVIVSVPSCSQTVLPSMLGRPIERCTYKGLSESTTTPSLCATATTMESCNSIVSFKGVSWNRVELS